MYYDTTLLNPGDVLRLPLQADATALATGRYGYQIAVTAHYSTPATTTYTGNVSHVSPSGSVFGPGWSLAGMTRLHALTGGALLDQGGGASLWYADAGSGNYTSPAGDRATLVRNANNTYTRTLHDGTTINYDTAGKQTSVVDRNGNAVAFAYDTQGRIATVTDASNLATTFTYNGSGLVSSITDPFSRTSTLSYNSGRLSGITDPDPDGSGSQAAPVFTYAYSGTTARLASMTDAGNETTTFTYDAFNRASGVTRPDSTTEGLTPLQVRGLPASGTGTSGSPAAPVLVVGAQATHTDARGKVWNYRLDGLGFGAVVQAADPLGRNALSPLDGTGMIWYDADPLGRATRSFFDASGNVTKVVHPDGKAETLTYNGFGQVLTRTNELGYVTTNTYSSTGNLLTVTQPDPDGTGPLTAPVTAFAYAGDGKVTSLTDPLGRVTTYGYDSRDQLTQVVHPDGDSNPNNNPTESYAYDGYGNRTGATDARGFTTAFTYDLLNRLTLTTLPDNDSNPANNPKWATAYDVEGNVTAVTDPLNHTTTRTYDSMDRVLTVTDPLNHTTTYTYNATGAVTAVANALNQATTYGYDNAGRRTTTTDPLGRTTTVGYDAASQVVAETDPAGNTDDYAYNARGWLSGTTDPLDNEESYTYDGAGHRTGKGVAQFGSPPKTRAYTYDNLGRLTTDKFFGQATFYTTTYAYDAAGNRTSVTNPLGHSTTTTYDARNRPVEVRNALNQIVVATTYDLNGNVLTTTDALSHTTTRTYDAQNRLLTSTDALGGATSYAYDLKGRLASITDPVNNVTSYTYDAADRLVTTTDPLNHTTTNAYDAANRLTQVTDRNGRVRTYTYDAAGARTSEKWLDSGNTIIRTVSYAYDNQGRQTTNSDSDSSYTYTYDLADRLAGVDNLNTPGMPRLTLAYAYDASGNRTEVADNHGGSVAFTYDGADRLVHVAMFTDIEFLPPPFASLTYDGASRVTQIVRGGVASAYGYDYADRLTSITNTTSLYGTLSTFTYTYDSAGRITNSTGPEGTLNYTYDNKDQLTGTSGARTESYSYDANGNRTLAGYVTGTGNRLLNDGTNTYTYDNEGNTLSKTRTSDSQKSEYTWDYRNRLTKVIIKSSGGTVLTEVRFTYDVNDRRIGKWVDADGAGSQPGAQQWFAYDGVNTYADFDANGDLTVRYLYGTGIDQLLARYHTTVGQAAYLTDHLGSVRQIVSVTGVVLDALTYDSYGQVLSETNPGNGDRFQYTSREWDAEVGLQYNRNRYFVPAVGGWLSEDPLGFAAGDANLRRYVHNTPVGKKDPDGLCEDDPLYTGPYQPFAYLGTWWATDSALGEKVRARQEKIRQTESATRLYQPPAAGSTVLGSMQQQIPGF